MNFKLAHMGVGGLSGVEKGDGTNQKDNQHIMELVRKTSYYTAYKTSFLFDLQG
jgi:hypothetical protein